MVILPSRGTRAIMYPRTPPLIQADELVQHAETAGLAHSDTETI
jgi:hypothetical protein